MRIAWDDLAVVVHHPPVEVRHILSGGVRVNTADQFEVLARDGSHVKFKAGTPEALAFGRRLVQLHNEQVASGQVDLPDEVLAALAKIGRPRSRR